MMRVLRIFVVMTVLFAVLVTPATAMDGRPAVGAVMGEHGINPYPFIPEGECPGLSEEGWQFFSSGRGRISQLGRVTYDLVQCTEPDGGTPVSQGTIVFTTKKGDTLTVAQEVTSKLYGDPTGPPDGFTLRGTWTVVDGTGRFTDASGSGRMFGIGDVDVPVPDGKRFYGIRDGKVLFTFVGRIALFDGDN
ncbi:MAG: hypothetical protein QNJ71_01765 [Acidimicrobiia bacterium]|nr:hypothetical protein [Acidimicrobiia bacterium]